MVVWLSFLAVMMNLFVMKQISLGGFEVTCSDALAAGYLLGQNLIQEFFGNKAARRTIWITLFISLSFLILSQIHLLYQPNSFDQTQIHFVALLSPAPRLFIASLISFLIVQMIDLSFFSFLRREMNGRFFPIRTLICLILAETLDTVLFSFLGLYGWVGRIDHVILTSTVFKILIVSLYVPFVSLSKKIAQRG